MFVEFTAVVGDNNVIRNWFIFREGIMIFLMFLTYIICEAISAHNYEEAEREKRRLEIEHSKAQWSTTYE
jgi:hypothetical protein